MAEKFKPFFERSLVEQAELLQPQILKVQQENLSFGLYNSYRTSNYPSDNTFIHQYADHSELVRVDAATGNTETIKIL
jgi:hypothetical protein